MVSGKSVDRSISAVPIIYHFINNGESTCAGISGWPTTPNVLTKRLRVYLRIRATDPIERNRVGGPPLRAFRSFSFERNEPTNPILSGSVARFLAMTPLFPSSTPALICIELLFRGNFTIVTCEDNGKREYSEKWENLEDCASENTSCV